MSIPRESPEQLGCTVRPPEGGLIIVHVCLTPLAGAGALQEGKTHYSGQGADGSLQVLLTIHRWRGEKVIFKMVFLLTRGRGKMSAALTSCSPSPRLAWQRKAPSGPLSSGLQGHRKKLP